MTRRHRTSTRPARLSCRKTPPLGARPFLRSRRRYAAQVSTTSLGTALEHVLFEQEAHVARGAQRVAAGEQHEQLPLAGLEADVALSVDTPGAAHAVVVDK